MERSLEEKFSRTIPKIKECVDRAKENDKEYIFFKTLYDPEIMSLLYEQFEPYQFIDYVFHEKEEVYIYHFRRRGLEELL